MVKRTRTRKKEKKFLPEGRAYVQASFNNTMITFTDKTGKAIAQSSSGAVGFKGSRKSTAFAAQKAGEAAARAALATGMKTVDIFVKGPGSGREAAIRSIQSVGIYVSSIHDVTPLPHNGCRPPKRRRG